MCTIGREKRTSKGSGQYHGHIACIDPSTEWPCGLENDIAEHNRTLNIRSERMPRGIWTLKQRMVLIYLCLHNVDVRKRTTKDILVHATGLWLTPRARCARRSKSFQIQHAYVPKYAFTGHLLGDFYGYIRHSCNGKVCSVSPHVHPLMSKKSRDGRCLTLRGVNIVFSGVRSLMFQCLRPT